VRRTASEKMEIIRLVEGTDLPVRATLRQMGVPRSTFYGGVQRYEEMGFEGLHDKTPAIRASTPSQGAARASNGKNLAKATAFLPR